MKTLVLIAHPDLQASRGNRRMREALAGHADITIRELYPLYPDFRIRPEHVAEEQRLLLEHDAIVFQHPFYWYSAPALLKEWMDRVLSIGFAYGPGGDKLRGKLWLSAITTGGPEEAYRSGGYHHFTISELMRPFQQTANLAGMVWQPVFVTHSVLPSGVGGLKNLTDAELDSAAAAYAERVRALGAAC